MKKSIYFLTFFIVLALIIKIFVFSSQTAQKNYQLDFNRDYKIYALNLPEKLSFSTEPVPLDESDIRERLDRELLVNTYWQSQTLLLIKRANRWFPVIEPILKKNGIPEDFKYIPLIESGFLNRTSPSGAVGFWQFLNKTAQSYGLETNKEVDERYDVKKSTEAACKYLKTAYKALGNWTLSAASYNMGIYGIRKQLNRQKVSSYYDLLLNIETSRYIFRILAVKEILSNPQKYGFHYLNHHLYEPYETFTISIDTAVDDFADFASEHNITYKTLKIYNPWLRQSYLKNKEGEKYNIEIPINKIEKSQIAGKDGLINASNYNVVLDSLNIDKEDSLVIHKVTRGETIFTIAKKYQVRVPQILQWNNLGDYYVRRGQKLSIYLEKEDR